MNLTDRYLARARSWLPRKDQQAVTDALREAIDDQMIAREATLGRPLSEHEITCVLGAFGHPALAAARYTSLKPLIDRGLMLVYRRILALGLAAIVIIQTLLVAVQISGAAPVGAALMDGLGRAATGACIGFTCTTLVFAFLSRTFAGPGRPE